MSVAQKNRITLPLFKGESDTWEIFKLRFRSVARIFNKDSSRIIDMVNKSQKKFIDTEKDSEEYKALSAEQKKQKEEKSVRFETTDKFDDANATLFSYLVQSLNDETFDAYRSNINEDDGESLWRALVNDFDKKSLIELVGLLVEVFNYKMEENTELKTYFSELSNKITRLNSLGKEWNFTVSNMLHLGMAVNGLHNRYTTSVNSVLSSPTKPSLKILKDRLISEDNRDRVRGESSDTKPGSSYNARNGGKNDCPKCGKNHGGRKCLNHITCHRCGLRGHYMRDCRVNLDNKRGGKFKPRKANGAKNEKGEVKKGRDKRMYMHVQVPKSVLTAVGSYKSRTKGQSRVILDSGTDDHYFKDVEASSLSKVDVQTIRGAFGQKVEICRSGSLGDFGKVLYHPSITENLASISKLCQKGFKVLFEGKYAYIFRKTCQISWDEKPVQTGRLENGLYCLDVKHRGPLYDPQNDGKCANGCVHDYNNDDESYVYNVHCDTNAWHLHKRYGHPSVNVMRMLRDSKMLKHFTLDKKSIEMIANCKVCRLSKSRNKPHYREKSEQRERSPGAKWHYDVCGWVNPTGRGGMKYFLVGIDAATRLLMCKPLQRKSDATAEIIHHVKNLKALHGVVVKTVRTDNGGEFVNSELSAFFKTNCINHERTNFYSSESNGVAERMIQKVCQMARTMMSGSELSQGFWPLAVRYAAKVLNRLPCTVNPNNASPYSMFFGEKPVMSDFHVFGSRCYVTKNKRENVRSQKFVHKGKECFYIGIPLNQSGVLVYDPSKINRRDQIYATSDVDFTLGDDIVNENSDIEITFDVDDGDDVLERESVSVDDNKNDMKIDDDVKADDVKQDAKHDVSAQINQDVKDESVGIGGESKDDEGGDRRYPRRVREAPKKFWEVGSANFCADKECKINAPHSHETIVHAPTRHAYLCRKDIQDNLHYHDNDAYNACNEHVNVARGLHDDMPDLEGSDDESDDECDDVDVNDDDINDDIKDDKIETNNDSKYSDRVTKGWIKQVKARDVPVPRTIKQALDKSNRYRKFWLKGIRYEFHRMIKMGVFRLVNRYKLKGDKLLKSTWSFRVKPDERGFCDRFRARLCACGYSQVYGVHFKETFAPTARGESLRVFLTHALERKLFLGSADFKSAYLNAKLDYDLYMRVPSGTDLISSEEFIVNQDTVIKLEKQIYGLRQSGRGWYKLLRGTLIKLGFKPLIVEPCIFIRVDVNLLLHTDDMLMSGDEKSIKSFIDELKNENLEVKYMGAAKMFCGCKIVYDMSAGEIILDHSEYVEKLLADHGMSESKPVKTPATAACNEPPEEDLLMGDPSVYRSGVGGLLYLSIVGRPDICFAVGRLTRKMQNPTEHDFVQLKRVFRYLKGTPHVVSVLTTPKKGDTLCALSDSDFAGYVPNRRSTSGYVLLYGNNVVSYKSSLQKSCATSTCHAELLAACLCVKEVIFIKNLMHELGMLDVKDTTIVHVDNDPMMKLSKNPMFHKRSKHFSIRSHWLREQCENGVVELCRVPTKDNTADIFTKPLQGGLFSKHRGSLVKVNQD